MSGPFITSIPGLPCAKCGATIRVGTRVFYPSGWITDDDRTCVGCVDLDLFGASA